MIIDPAALFTFAVLDHRNPFAPCAECYDGKRGGYAYVQPTMRVGVATLMKVLRSRFRLGVWSGLHHEVLDVTLKLLELHEDELHFVAGFRSFKYRKHQDAWYTVYDAELPLLIGSVLDGSWFERKQIAFLLPPMSAVKGEGKMYVVARHTAEGAAVDLTLFALAAKIKEDWPAGSAVMR